MKTTAIMIAGATATVAGAAQLVQRLLDGSIPLLAAWMVLFAALLLRYFWACLRS